MKILVVDDHAVVRRGVKEILLEEIDKVTVGEAATAPEMFDQLKKGRWDLVVLDIGIPGRSGLDALEESKKHYPKLPVLILSARPEDQLAVRTIKAGANGYLTKETAPEELVTAIKKVRSGGTYVSPALAETLALSVHESVAKLPHECLSDREYQILCLLAIGKTTTEISGQLSLSGSTISTYRSRILQKMHMKTKSELTRYAIQQGLVR